MIKSKNEPLYLKVLHDKKASPALPLSVICKKYGVKYINYNNWLKTQQKRQSGGKVAPAAAKSHRAPATQVIAGKTITIKLSIEELVNALLKKKSLVIPTDQILSTLAPEQKPYVEALVGKRYLSEVQKPKAIFANPHLGLDAEVPEHFDAASTNGDGGNIE